MGFQRVRPPSMRPVNLRPLNLRPTRLLTGPNTVVSVNAGVVSVSRLGGFAAAQLLFQAGISVGTTLGGGVVSSRFIRGGITSDPNLGGLFGISGVIRQGIRSNANLGGFFPTFTPSSTNPEGRRTQIGHRPYMPLLVYGIGITDVSDLMNNPLQQSSEFHIPLESGDTFPVAGGFQIPNNGSFLLSEEYAPHGGPFEQAGAQSSYVGTLFVSDTGQRKFIFRPPREDEVVWYIELRDETIDLPATDGSGTETYPLTIDHGLFRFRNGAWEPYRSVPERWYKGQDAIDLLDPDGAVEYYTRLMGASHFEQVEDAIDIRKLIDPDDVPDRFIFDLASVFDLALREQDGEAVNRRRLRGIIRTNRRKGLSGLIEDRLRQFGFIGYANVVWVNPTDSDNWEKFQNAPQRIQNDIQSRGLKSDIEAGSGQKGQDVLDKPFTFHPFSEEEQFDSFPYVASSRLSIHLRYPNGEPVLESQINPSELKERIARELIQDILPAPIDIRFWISDVASERKAAGVSDDIDVEFPVATTNGAAGIQGSIYVGTILGGSIA